MKTNSGDQPPDISNTSKQTNFNDFLEQNKGEKKTYKHDIIWQVFSLQNTW